MQFKNPVNGHVETRYSPWLWTLLFGGLYLLLSGLWAPALAWFLLAIFLYASLGPPATLLMIPIQLLFAAFAVDMVANSYLRRGWVNAAAVEAQDDAVRHCPYCAEDIKPEAIKCKHCGSDVSTEVSR